MANWFNKKAQSMEGNAHYVADVTVNIWVKPSNVPDTDATNAHNAILGILSRGAQDVESYGFQVEGIRTEIGTVVPKSELLDDAFSGI